MEKADDVPSAELRRDGARTFVVDGAGMGKSTYVRHLINEAIGADDAVPVLLELSRIRDGETLMGALAREFDELDREFDRELIYRLFAVGRFLFILDGLDEVASERRREMLAQIEELGRGSEKSALVVTTRPETPLPNISGARTVTIRPLTLGQAESLVRRYDRALGELDIGARLTTRFPAIPKRFLQTPLLVTLLYRTFAYTKSIEVSITIFYDELFNALYKGHDLTKSGYVRDKASELDVATFRRLLRAFSFLTIVNQKATSLRGEAEAQEFTTSASGLSSVSPASSAAFVEDLLSAVPLLVREGNALRFVHKSIAEFFAAEYLVYGDPDGEQMISDILNGALVGRFAEVLDFIADLDPPLFRRAVVAPVASQAALHAPDDDPLFRTLTFMGTVVLGRWPASTQEDETDPPFPAWSMSYFFGEHDGSPAEIHVVLGNPRSNLSPAIWRQITEVIPYAQRRGHNEAGFSILARELPEKKWIPITDASVRAAAKDANVRDILTSALTLLSRMRKQEPRLLSDGKIREVAEKCHLDRLERDSLRSFLRRRP
ncbi:MAG TPA: NACHT domain-containing protein [Longimicrobium sp.]|jgi:hypothetical protein